MSTQPQRLASFKTKIGKSLSELWGNATGMQVVDLLKDSSAALCAPCDFRGLEVGVDFSITKEFKATKLVSV